MKNHGGKRQGAGRPTGTGVYKTPTKVMRIPEDKVDDVKAFLLEETSKYQIPLYESTVSAGTPFGTSDHVDRKLDLNEHLIKHPASTFFVRAAGQSMVGAGIDDGDMLIVDKSLNASNGKIIIAVLNGELTVKRYVRFGDIITLVAENDEISNIEINEHEDFSVWGVVTSIVKEV